MKAKSKISANKVLKDVSITIKVVGIRTLKFKLLLVKFLIWVIKRLLKPQSLHVSIDNNA
jgi:hypothetical protein